MDNQDDFFRLTCDALKAKQTKLKKQGKGNRPSKVDAITDEEINILYEMKILGNETPEALLYTLWLNNSIHFGLTGVTEHYNLRWRGLQIKKTQLTEQNFSKIMKDKQKQEQGKILSTFAKSNPKCFRLGMQEIRLIFTNFFCS